MRLKAGFIFPLFFIGAFAMAGEPILLDCSGNSRTEIYKKWKSLPDHTDTSQFEASVVIDQEYQNVFSGTYSRDNKTDLQSSRKLVWVIRVGTEEPIYESDSGISPSGQTNRSLSRIRSGVEVNAGEIKGYSNQTSYNAKSQNSDEEMRTIITINRFNGGFRKTVVGYYNNSTVKTEIFATCKKAMPKF